VPRNDDADIATVKRRTADHVHKAKKMWRSDKTHPRSCSRPGGAGKICSHEVRYWFGRVLSRGELRGQAFALVGLSCFQLCVEANTVRRLHRGTCRKTPKVGH
jgi:hypothetical protein